MLESLAYRSSKIPVDDYLAIRKMSIHYPDADSLVLGKYTKDAKSYVSMAEAEKSSYFSLGEDWDALKTQYGLTDKDMFDNFNIPALDDAVNLDKTIKFTHNPTDYGGALLDEWDYLKSNHGYTSLEKIGDFYYAE